MIFKAKPPESSHNDVIDKILKKDFNREVDIKKNS